MAYIERCLKAIQHGPTDSYGKCPFCGEKVERTAIRPNTRTDEPSELEMAYKRFYDPDWGTDRLDY